MIHDTQSAQISQKQDGRNIYVYIYIYVIMMYGWPHDMSKCMSCHKAIVVITGMAHCFHDYIYIYIYIYIYKTLKQTLYGHALIWWTVLRKINFVKLPFIRSLRGNRYQ